VKEKSVRILKEPDVALEYDERGELVNVRSLENAKSKPVKEDLVSLKAMDIIAFNSVAERRFVQLLTALCNAAGPAGVPVRSARGEIAFRLNISTETVKRYLEKWCATSAPFAIRDGAIFRKGAK